MAGSPIKRARKAGAPIPNLGTRPPRGAAQSRTRARACALPDPNRPLEPDPELSALGKRVLRTVAEQGEEEKNRVSAARALVEVTRAADKRTHEISVSLHSLSGEDLQRLEVKAREVLGGEA